MLEIKKVSAVQGHRIDAFFEGGGPLFRKKKHGSNRALGPGMVRGWSEDGPMVVR